MPEKYSTIILTVDLGCCRCYKKIRKVLCKIQDRENIRTIDYDEKKNTVTISGPFDPHKLSKKLCCKACKIIIDITIKEPEEPPPPPPPPPPEPEPAPPPPPEPEPAPPPPPEPKPAPPPPPKPESPKPDCPPCTPGPVCCCRPWFEWYPGGCRCCSCGVDYYGWCHGPPPAVYSRPCCDGPKTCQFFYEEDPATCAIM